MGIGAQPVILDEERLDRLTHNQPSGKKQIFSMFTENALECLSAMEKACANDDDELWIMATGELHSLADVIGADDFAGTIGLAKQVESQLMSERKQLIMKVRKEFERLRSYFDSKQQ